MTRAFGVDGRAVIVSDRGLTQNVIPDSDIYLQDDWDDGKLQNRDGSDITPHNGETGVYRPEWTIAAGSPNVDNNELYIPNANSNGEQQVYANYPANNIDGFTADFGKIDTGGAYYNGFLMIIVFQDSSNWLGIEGSGKAWSGGGESSLVLRQNDNFNHLITGPDLADGNTHTAKVTHDGTDTYEFFVDGTSQGTYTDSFLPTPNQFRFSLGNRYYGSNKFNSWVRIDDIKVS